jgi:hypothetical protein
MPGRLCLRQQFTPFKFAKDLCHTKFNGLSIMSLSRSGPVTSRLTSLPPCGLISFILFPSFVHWRVRSPRVSKGNARCCHLLASTQQSAASFLESRMLASLALPHGRASDTPSSLFVHPVHVLRCIPHSVLTVPRQRPARGSSPICTGVVQGAQPMDR